MTDSGERAEFLETYPREVSRRDEFKSQMEC